MFTGDNSHNFTTFYLNFSMVYFRHSVHISLSAIADPGFRIWEGEGLMMSNATLLSEKYAKTKELGSIRRGWGGGGG